MLSKVEKFIAFRYLRPKRAEGFISVIAGFSFLGIMIGVATLIIVMAVMNGFRTELLDRVLGLNAHVMVMHQNQGMKFDPDLLKKLQQIDPVITVSPMIEGQTLVTRQNVAFGALVKALRPEDIKTKTLVMQKIVAGDIANFQDNDGILIGAAMARKLGVKAGDKIKLISPTANITALGALPRARSFQIAAIFDVGMHEYDSTYIFMPLMAAQTFYQKWEQIDGLEIYLADPDQVKTIKPIINQAAGPEYRVVDWQQMNGAFFNAIEVEKNVMFLILTLIILVAALNVVSSMIMLVKNKGQDIAILRTMGATPGFIMRVFMIAGGSIGIVGTILGVVLGVAFAENIESVRQFIESLSGNNLFNEEIYFLSHLPARIDWAETMLVIIMALALSFLATLYPAWRASRIDPVEALRYE